MTAQNLPEWIGKLNNSEEYWNDQDSQKILEALAIAVEALGKIKDRIEYGDSKDKPQIRDGGAQFRSLGIAKDALRRIEEIGK